MGEAREKKHWHFIVETILVKIRFRHTSHLCSGKNEGRMLSLGEDEGKFKSGHTAAVNRSLCF